MARILERLGLARPGTKSGWIDTPRGRTVLTVVAVALYVLPFGGIYDAVGLGVCALSLLPVVVVAWLLGSFGGLLAGVASLPLNAWLLDLAGADGWGLLLGAETVEGPALVIVVGAVVGLLRDLGVKVERQIEEARKVHTALRDREDRYRTLFEETRDAVCILDEEGRFVDVNRAGCDLLDRTERELRDTGIEETLADPDEAGELARELRETGSVRNRDLVLRTKEGEDRHCFLTAVAREDEEGTVTGYEAIVHDVTERKRVEDQLRHFQRIDAMGQLTGGVAHDFNNILTVILSNADLVRNALPEDDAEARSFVEELEGAAHRGTRLVGKLLAFARKEELVLEATDLNRTVEEATDTLRRLLPESIEIRVFAEEPIPPVRADRGAVEQILMNLATNARDAMPKGGVLWIHLTETEFTEEDRRLQSWIVPGRYACVAVSDTGVGMDEETRRRIFEPFFTTKSAGEGTGLGMAVIYGLVKQHDGFIHLYSEEGYGTTVKVYFPITDGEPEGRRPPGVDADLSGGTEKVLVAEDEEPLRKAASRGLESLGYRTVTARNGREALEILEREPGIDVVVADMVMPHMGGAELLRALRRHDPDLRIVLTSGYAGTSALGHLDLDELRTEGRVTFLQKPWTVVELARKIRSVLSAD